MAAATAFALIGDRFHNSDYIRTGVPLVVLMVMTLSVLLVMFYGL